MHAEGLKGARCSIVTYALMKMTCIRISNPSSPGTLFLRLYLLRICQLFLAPFPLLAQTLHLTPAKTRTRRHYGRWKRERTWQHITVRPTSAEAPFRIEATRARQQPIRHKSGRQCRYWCLDIIPVVVIRTGVLVCRRRRSGERVGGTRSTRAQKRTRGWRWRRKNNSRVMGFRAASCRGGTCRP